ncbi:hypothetical protein SEMRO_2836_G338200.1 [Seminavis robusta]|uniref:Uncharacterized protein n=1 Tax=Seminavis robusta TaxID=568900 RepID=A0A9N8F0K1_9STRA|nr:hypothetical protein SEMRO_2836_G338200.1 [Seminavis robusta]|eukprot:Sro2836_g338200.1 n/a (357) ;mRNA; r:54-1124
MVVQRGFSLQLVDAETQQPLKEYIGPSGVVHYAQAKPGGEYFLRFHVLHEEKTSEESTNKENDDHGSSMYYFRPSVDGKDLGFYTNLTEAQGARDVGLWTYINGIGTNQALKFDEAPAAKPGSVASTATERDVPSSEAPAKTGPPRLHMGNVQVQVSKAVFTGYQKRVYATVPALTQEETVVAETAVSISANSSVQEVEEEEVSSKGANNAKDKDNSQDSNKTEGSMEPVAVLRSREGKARFEQKFTEECTTYKPGELVETITIHYGSTEALIQAGVLLPGGTVPQYVKVAPAPVQEVTTEQVKTIREDASATTGERPVASGPLLDASASTAPSGTKRFHDENEVSDIRYEPLERE